MSETLVEVDSFDAEIPGIDDGSEGNEATFETPIQKLANRTKYLRARIEADGVKILYSAASIAAMKALTGMVTGQLCLVAGYGLYRFDSSSTVTNETVSPVVVAPDTGSGRWVLVRAGLRETGNATTLASLTPLYDSEIVLVRSLNRLFRYYSGDSSTVETNWIVTSTAGRWIALDTGLTLTNGGAAGDKRRLDPGVLAVPNRIISVTERYVAGPFTFAPGAASPGTAFGTAHSLAVELGDIVLIDVNLGKIIDQGNQLTVIVRNGTTVLGNGKATLPAAATSAPRHLAFRTRFVADASATLSIQCGGICASASDVEVTDYQIITTLVRP